MYYITKHKRKVRKTVPQWNLNTVLSFYHICIFTKPLLQYTIKIQNYFITIEISIMPLLSCPKPFSSVQLLSRVWLFASTWTTACQVSLSITNSRSLLKLMSIESVIPSNPLILCCPLLLPPSVFPRNKGLSQWVGSLHQVAKVLEFQLQHPSFQWIFRTDFLEDWLVGSPRSPRDSQESSLIPQFNSINSSALSFLYIPALTSIHDNWKINSFD